MNAKARTKATLRIQGFLVGGIVLALTSTAAIAQRADSGAAPPLADQPTLPQNPGSHVPITGSHQLQPGGGGTENLPDPLASPAAKTEQRIEVPSGAAIVQPRDLTGAPLTTPVPDTRPLPR